MSIRPRRPGVNNLVLPGTAMPHVLWELQGAQDVVWEGRMDAQGNASKHFKEFKSVSPGKLSPEEYDAFVRDTVNFLDYIAEPIQLEAAGARLSRDRIPAVLHAARVPAEEGILEGRQVVAAAAGRFEHGLAAASR